MHGLARLIAIGIAFGACKDSPRPIGREPVQRPGIDGLVEFLEPLARVGKRDGAVHARILYADDAEVPADLRRSRMAYPIGVGRPPLVASIDGEWLPVLFVFRERWEHEDTLDAQVAAGVDDACRAAYLNSAHGRCLDFTGALAAAVLAADTAARERLCTLMVAHGCGSVPAEAPLSQP